MDIKYEVTFTEVEKIRKLVTTRMICSSVSLASCVLIMIVYFILFFQTICERKRRMQLITNANYQKEKEINSSFQRTGSMSSTKSKQNSQGFGLGSHAMFFLILTNLLWSINSVFCCLLYPKGFSFLLDNYLTLCPVHGFLHNYFDLASIGWTTVISYLFYSSMKAAAFNPNEEKKKLIQGSIFSFGFPIMICLGPFYSSSYGPTGSYCSINRLNESKYDTMWGWVLQAYSFICIIYCFVAVIKVSMFYHKKLILVKEHNLQEYKSLRKYVYIFLLFPIVLSLSRILKLVNFALKKYNNNVEQTGAAYVYAITFSLNGFFNSLLCLFFFRRAIMCCKGNERTLSEIDTSSQSDPVAGQEYKELLSRNGNEGE